MPLFRLCNLPLAGATLLAILFLLASLPGAAAGDGPSCSQKRLTIVAHEDDDLIFQNPAILEAIAAGDCVRTVYVTAGDAGKGETYWRDRELGPRAAYAQMAGVANSWTNSTPSVAGHTINLATLTAHPQVSQVNLRLPDAGGATGTGYAVNGNQSVPRLWRSQNPQPAGLGPISSINAVDGSATYTYGGLLATLEALIEEFEPDVIGTQNFNAEFGGGDHADHIAVARFVYLAEGSYTREHLLRSYMDYESKNQAQNVFEPVLGKKLNAYYAYAVHDSNEACASQAACESPFYAEYWSWLKRQYVVTQRAVPGANAGSAQAVASQAQVTLDGSGSSDPLGHSLGYEWTQTGGPAVTLSNSHAIKPIFTAPTGPATLSFSLVVKSTEASSAPDPVTVTVAAPPKFTLTVTTSGNGAGTVTSSPAGISCPTDCEGSYDQGTKVTLTPSPAAGSEFKGWSGACAGSGSCEVTLGSTKTVGAEFALQRHQLSVSKSGTGSGTVSSSPAGISCGATCSANFDHGTKVTLTPSPAAGSEFKGWSGACSGTGSCEVTMSSAKSVAAEFALQRHALTVAKSGSGLGTITSSPVGISCGATCAANFDHGTEVTLTPAASPGSEFKGWSGACAGAGSCVVTMSAAKSVGAEFALELHQLTVTKSGSGSGTVSSSPVGISCGATCAASFDHGALVRLTGSPGPNAKAVVWETCPGTVNASNQCEVTMSQVRSATARFDLEKHALTVTRSGTGSGTVSSAPAGISCGATCSANFDHGTLVKLSGASAAGSKAVAWSGCDKVNGANECEVTVSAVKAVTATFELEQRLLSVTKSGTGTGTVSSSPVGISCGATCAANFDHGTEVTLSASPAAGSEFKGWSGACTGAGSCVVSMSAPKSVGAEFALVPKFALSVSTSGNGAGTVTSSPGGISCPTDCEGSYEQGTKVTLTPAASPGSEFKGWSGACVGTGACEVTMSAAKSVAVEFALQRHALAVAKSGTGAGTVTSAPAGISCGATCAANFDHGTEVTLSASPAAGSEFKGWSGACTGAGSCVVSMSAAKSVGAEFALELHQLTVTKSGSGSGTVTSTPAGINCGAVCSANFDHGTLVKLSGASAASSKAVAWSGCDKVNGANECEVTVSAVKSVTAIFDLEQHSLTVAKSGAGSGAVSSSPVGISCGATCAANFDHGTEVTLSASPAAGSEFKGWSGACSGTGSCVVTMSAAKAVSAEFAPVPKFALKVSLSGNGGGSVTSSPAGIECGADCEEAYEQGTKVTLTPSPAAGSEFKGWSGACVGVGTCEVAISAAKEVGAQFALQRHALSVTKSGAGSGTITSSPAGIACGATCSASFDHGTEVTLTASPAAESKFMGWSGCDQVDGTKCEVTMDAAGAVTATFSLIGHNPLTVTTNGSGAGTVTSSPAGIDCGSECSTDFAEGTLVILTGISAEHSKNVVWETCPGTINASNQCEVTMSQARSATARFDLEQHTLTVTKGGSGTGTITSAPSGISCGATCSANLDHGTLVKLTGAPGPNSESVVWESCAGTVNASNQCEVTMSAAKTATAVFTLESHQLSVVKNGSGTGTVTSSPTGISCGAKCASGFTHGTLVKLTGAPGAGSKSVAWSGCDKVNGANECEVTVSAVKSVTAVFDLEQHSLTVTKSGIGAGTVSGSPAGISCGAVCSASFDHGTEVTLTASPAAGSEFKGWSGACSGTESCVVTMSAAKSVAAEFAPVPKFALKVSLTGNGSGSVASSPTGIECGSDCEQSYEQGQSVTLSASPAIGSEFKGWSGAGCSGTGSCVISISGAKEVSAQFTLQRHALTVTRSGAGTGTVSSAPAGISCGATCVASFDHGTEVTLSASPAAGSEFKGWSGACAGSGSCVVSMSAAKSVGAEFALQRHALTVTKSGTGSGIITSAPAGISCGAVCSASFDHGVEVTLSASPSVDSETAAWTGCDRVNGADECEVTMNADETVEASFARKTPQLSVTLAGAGSGTVTSSPAGIECGADCSQQYDYGATVQLSGAPDAGSRAVVWSNCDQVNGANECEVTMSAAKAVVATFSALDHNPLTVTKTGSGTGTITASPAGIDCGSQCAAEYPEATMVTLTGVGGAHSQFAWETCPGTVNTSNQCEVSMTEARSATARFDLDQHTLTVTKDGAGAGTASSAPVGISCGSKCTATFEHGTVVTLSATADEAGTIAWSGCDEIVAADECKVAMNADREVSATVTPATVPPTPTPPVPPAPEPPPAPETSGTRLLKAKIRPDSAKFVFAAQDIATRFRCALARPQQKLKYKPCSSPTTYRNLKPGRYIFKVKAVGPQGADPVPVTKRFQVPVAAP